MKDIVAVTGKYTKDGQEKANFTKIGAIGFSQQSGKEFVLLDPTVSLSGVLAKQNALAVQNGEQQRDNIMCSVIDKSARHQAQQYNQQPQQQQGGQYQGQPQQQAPSVPNFDDDTPW